MAESEFAKTHLREYLGSLLVSPISEGFWSIYDSSKKLCEQNGQMAEVLRTFQNMLTRIPDWTDTTLTAEVERITKVTKCGYLDDLIMGVFISYMKSFASLHYQGGSTEIKIEFDRPSLSKFIHELYKQSARKLWQVAYLFKTIGVTTEQQARNRQEVDKYVSDCLEHVIRGFLPWDSITKKYFIEPPEVALPELSNRNVSFGADSESDSDEDEEKPSIKVSEEEATITFNNLDEPAREKEVQVEISAIDEINNKANDTLVLDL